MKKLNFIIIYADDLGFGDLGCYGASGIPTPNLDRMAAGGLRFTNSYATAATCTPSRYSLLTGSYPWRNPKAKILAGDAPMIINRGERTLPGSLREGGYTTAVIGKWHIGLGDGGINWNGDITPCPLDVGFDESYIMAATNDRVPCVYVDGRRVDKLDPADPISVVYGGENPFPEVPTGKDRPELLKVRHSDHQHWDTIVNGVGRIGFCKGGKAAEWVDETMTDIFLCRAKEFVSKNKDKPFFLYYALHQPHVPRIPSPRFAGTTGKGPRGDVIAELDWCVGEILDHLKDLGIEEDTMVVFSSDNGPVLDDGYLDDAREKCGDHKPAGPLRGGKYSMYDGGSRVPMILHAPGRVEPGECPALFSHADFLASFTKLAGMDLPREELADSREMSAALLGKDSVGRDNLVTEGIGAQTVVREMNWVFIPPHDGPKLFADKGIETGNSPDPQLYDLDTDIGQRGNVADQHPDKVAALNALLESIHGDTPPAGDTPWNVSEV
jgi:arylsulfatase A-like enzyme